jgi:hypothetical protein
MDSREGGEEMSGLLLTDGFDAITIRIENERSVIIITVFGMYARAAVVLAAMRQRCPIKRPYSLTGRRGESDMKTLTGYDDMPRAKFDGELITAVQQTVSNSRFMSPDADITQRGKGSIVKSAGALKVSNRE